MGAGPLVEFGALGSLNGDAGLHAGFPVAGLVAADEHVARVGERVLHLGHLAWLGRLSRRLHRRLYCASHVPLTRALPVLRSPALGQRWECRLFRA